MRARAFQGGDLYAFQCHMFSVLSAGVRQPSTALGCSPACLPACGSRSKPESACREKEAAPLPITWSEFAGANYIAGILLCLSALI